MKLPWSSCWGLFGWKVAIIYMSAGLSVAILAGFIIGKLKLEKWVEEYVYKIQSMEWQSSAVKTDLQGPAHLLPGSIQLEILQKVWVYVIVAIGIGGFIHGYAPDEFLAKYAGNGNPFAVPLAVAIGVPLYSNAAGVIPIVYALMEKGMSMGTVLAFMMAVTALSLPEMIILRKVLKIKLLAVFVGIMTVTIIGVGYLFNAIL